MKVTINLIALAVAGGVWYKFLKKPDSELTKVLESIPFYKSKQEDVLEGMLKEVGIIVSVYFLINKISR